MSLYFIASKADQLRNSKSPGKTNVEHSAIASPGLSGWIGCVQQSLQLFTVEIVDKSFVSFFERDRVDASHLFDSRRDAILDEMREGLDGSQTCVSCPCGVSAAGLNVFQERENQWRIQLLQGQSRRRSLVPLGSEAKQQLEGIGVRVTGVDTTRAIAGQILPEKRC
jgi:hypothetical protein